MDIGIAASKLKELFSSDGFIRIITHIDADGISSGAIIAKTLRQHNQVFWLSTLKLLEDDDLDELEEDIKSQSKSSQPCKALMFLDLGSSKINKIAKLAKFLDIRIFVIDHHHIEDGFNEGNNIHENLFFIHSNELSGAGLCYNFVKALNASKDLAQLAVVGMIGDILDRNISKSNSFILNEAQESGMQSKKSLTIFSAMRPLHKALELSSEIFIPGVTGSARGALKLLRGAGIETKKDKKSWRTLLDLSEGEMSRLITAILLRQVNSSSNNCHENGIINNI
ncbi:MAG: DHH family phosphoesterase, partial [Candidatus Aminicenantales bacterium]